MANSKLENRTYKVPDKVIQHLKQTLASFKGDGKTEGYTRCKKLIQDAKITYYEIKRMKHDMEQLNDKSAAYRLNGGDFMLKWIDHVLKRDRDIAKRLEKVKDELPDHKASDFKPEGDGKGEYSNKNKERDIYLKEAEQIIKNLLKQI